MPVTLPKHLFRYTRYSEFLLDGLRKNKVWYSSPDTFNDVFDCRFNLVGTSPTQNPSMLPKLFEGLTVEWLDLVPDPDGGPGTLKEGSADALSVIGTEQFQAVADEKLTPLLVDQFNSAIRNVGVHCLSETENSLLMWSHYADQHKGLCLTVSLKEAFVKQKGFTAKKVRYTTHYPEVSAVDFLADSHKVVDTVLLTKSIEWAYENEWRVVTPFTFRLTGSCIQNSLYESPYDIVAITFGSRMEPVQMRAIIEAAETHAVSELKYFVADPNPEKFAISTRVISREEIFEDPG
jgi:Protein of unknown function (DUF2971)